MAEIVEKKKGYYYDYTGPEDVDLSDFEPTKKKPLYVTLNNTVGNMRFDSSTNYADSGAVFEGRNETDINSLMAIYTKDTADCFVKAL